MLSVHRAAGLRLQDRQAERQTDASYSLLRRLPCLCPRHSVVCFAATWRCGRSWLSFVRPWTRLAGRHATPPWSPPWRGTLSVRITPASAAASDCGPRVKSLSPTKAACINWRRRRQYPDSPRAVSATERRLDWTTPLLPITPLPLHHRISPAILRLFTHTLRVFHSLHGAHETLIIAALSGFVQCVINSHTILSGFFFCPRLLHLSSALCRRKMITMI